MELDKIKVYRIGPIAAFDKSAHSVEQSLLSYYFALYGIESFLYLRTKTGEKDVKAFHEFLGINQLSNFKIKITRKHKGLSSLENFFLLILDLLKSRNRFNVLFLSKSSHVNFFAKFKRHLNFKIVFENHQNKTFLESVENADLTYVVSPEVFQTLKNRESVIFWDYHYPVSDSLFNIKTKTYDKNNKTTLGYVGSLNPEKGIDIVLKLIKGLKNLNLKIIGGNEGQIKKFKNAVKEYRIENQVTFTGFLPQNKLAQALQDVDILIAPFKKTQTTIPLKIYEYLATGIPVIASNIPPVRSVGKEFLYYFEPENFESLKSVVLYVSSNLEPAKNLAEKAKHYAKNFKWNHIIERILEDMERLL